MYLREASSSVRRQADHPPLHSAWKSLKASKLTENPEQAASLRAETQALAEAVLALRRMGTVETRKKLEQFQSYLDGTVKQLNVGHKPTRLSSLAPLWWVSCFTDLFFRS